MNSVIHHSTSNFLKIDLIYCITWLKGYARSFIICKFVEFSFLKSKNPLQTPPHTQLLKSFLKCDTLACKYFKSYSVRTLKVYEKFLSAWQNQGEQNLSGLHRIMAITRYYFPTRKVSLQGRTDIKLPTITVLCVNHLFLMLVPLLTCQSTRPPCLLLSCG